MGYIRVMDQKPNMFTIANQILDAIEQNRGIIQDNAPDSEEPERPANIVLTLSFEGDNLSMVNLSTLLTECAAAQVTDSEHFNSSTYDLGATRYKGRTCFYFKMPKGENWNIPVLRNALGKIQNLFKPAEFSPAALNFDRKTHALLGPYNPKELDEFKHLLPHIARYYGKREGGIMLKPFENDEGITYVAIPKSELNDLHLDQGRARFN